MPFWKRPSVEIVQVGNQAVAGIDFNQMNASQQQEALSKVNLGKAVFANIGGVQCIVPRDGVGAITASENSTKLTVKLAADITSASSSRTYQEEIANGQRNAFGEVATPQNTSESYNIHHGLDESGYRAE